jgi:hypothetical protein
VAVVPTATPHIALGQSVIFAPPEGKFRGEIGFRGEAYATDANVNRRDPLGGSVTAKASGSSGRFAYGMNLLFATEQSSGRQNINRVGLSIRTGIVGITLGDFSPRLSRYSADGITIRGGAAEVSYRGFFATALGGRSQRTVLSSAEALIDRAAASQQLFGGRVGYGLPDQTHIHVIGLVARDDQQAFPDSSEFTPRENVSVSPDVAVKLLDGRIFVRGTTTFAAYSPDSRRAAVEDASTPDMFGLFTTRVGSQYGTATEVLARLSHEEYSLRLSYERVSPGFRSLGLPYLRTDQEVISVRPEAHLWNRRVRVGIRYSHFRNNLDGTKASTLSRDYIGLTTFSRLSGSFGLTASYVYFGMTSSFETDPASGASFRQTYASHTFLAGPVITLRGASVVHTISATGTLQFMGDKNEGDSQGAAPSRETDNISATVSYGAVLRSGLSVTLAGNLLSSKSPSVDVTASGVSGTVGHPFAHRRAHTAITLSWSRNTVQILGVDDVGIGSRQLSLTFATSYRLASGNRIRLQLRGLSNSSDRSESTFKEMQATLAYQHRL